jgi:CHRD domain
MRSLFRIAPITLAAGLTVGAFCANAADVAVKLTGDQEVPAVASAATGAGTIVIKNDKSVSGSIKTSGIDGTVAHIHLAEPGKNGPPIITLNKTAENTWSVPEGSKLTDEQYKSFKDGNLYVNVHSAEHKGGEIRTQLKP